MGCITTNLVRIALRSSVSNYDGADRLAERFSEAGLPYPNLSCEELVGGSADSPLYGSLAELLQNLQPRKNEAYNGGDSCNGRVLKPAPRCSHRSAQPDLLTCAGLCLGAALNNVCF
jgi:hypothetical protein